MTRPNNSPLNLEQPGIIPRPEGQLQDLPLRLRWEATRRHPYYLVFWLNALLYQQGEIEELPEQRMMGTHCEPHARLHSCDRATSESKNVVRRT